jgi:CubicO group peptidase (beta-lactamase class C family)
VTQATVLSAIAQTPLRFTPGSAYEYSNSNYFILGSIIELISGGTYEEYLAAHLFQPADLTHTSNSQPLTAASPYSYRNPTVPGTTGLAVGIVPHPSGFFAAGALWSNVQDLTAWNAALRGGKIISAASFTSMIEPPAVPVRGEATASPYAMGWVRMTLLGRPFIWHNGQTLAYTSFNGVFLDNGFSVSVLTNVDQQEGTPLFPFAQNLIQSICGSAATAASC